MSSIDVNGTRLYHEERGRGPAVLFISGATGDAGHWTEAADILAVAYTVITYDRRANSRSPRPAGWASTTVGEQAADAAALLRGLDLEVLFGIEMAPYLVYEPTPGQLATIVASLIQPLTARAAGARLSDRWCRRAARGGCPRARRAARSRSSCGP